MVEDAMNVIQREEVSLEGMLSCRKKGREARMAGMDEQCEIFLEEELVSSMMHKYQRESSSLIGAFEYSLLLEAFELGCSEVGQVGKHMEEAKSGCGPSLEGQAPMIFNTSTSRMGLEEPVCSSLECPPGFEDYFDVIGPSKSPPRLSSSKGKFERENFLEEENGIDQCLGESLGSVEKVPQTPFFESTPNRQSDDYGVMIPFEEDLVEARITWDIGKMMGLEVSNEKAMVDAIAKVKEC